MAKTQEEAMAKLEELTTAVDAQLEESKKLVAAVKELIERIGQGGTAADFQPFIDKVEAEIAKLATDNTAVQEALDQATPPTLPEA